MIQDIGGQRRASAVLLQLWPMDFLTRDVTQASPAQRLRQGGPNGRKSNYQGTQAWQKAFVASGN